MQNVDGCHAKFSRSAKQIWQMVNVINKLWLMIMLPLQEELWRDFSPKQQTFWPGSLPYWGDDENKC